MGFEPMIPFKVYSLANCCLEPLGHHSENFKNYLYDKKTASPTKIKIITKCSSTKGRIYGQAPIINKIVNKEIKKRNK